MSPTPKWRRARLLAITIVIAAAAVVAVARGPLLRGLGGLLVLETPLQQADAAFMMHETQTAGAIELADLYAARMAPQVGVLIPQVSREVIELRRRGVRVTGLVDVIAQLGVPHEAITVVTSGEAGTTDGTHALAAWCRSRGTRRLIVITTAEHSRRVHRALLRAFGDAPPRVMLRTPRLGTFHAADWWRQRTTLRNGIIELQKLLLDYARHPLG